MSDTCDKATPTLTPTRTPTVGALKHTRTHHGTGKRVRTILADQGDHVTLVDDTPLAERRSRASGYSDDVTGRQSAAAPRRVKGVRAMHRSTLKIPMQENTDYLTTNKRIHEGIRSLYSDERPHPYPSQQMTQFTYSHQGITPPPWDTNYRHTYLNYGAQSPATLHDASVVNRQHMRAGSDVRRVLHVTSDDVPHPYITKYMSVHDKLGVMLGPGVPHQKAVRKSYHPLTGEDLGEGWSSRNPRTSGNRVLYNGYRREAQDTFVLG